MAARAPGRWLVRGLALALAVPAGASQLIPRTLADLGSGSQVIFVGRCEAVSSHWNEDHTLIFTTSRIRVSRALKGEPGSTFAVEELGGTVGATTLHVSGVPRFTMGEDVLLCAHRTPLGRWETFGAAQGKFEIARDERGRVWVDNGFYREQLAAMVTGGHGQARVPLAALAGRLQAAAAREVRP